MVTRRHVLAIAPVAALAPLALDFEQVPDKPEGVEQVEIPSTIDLRKFIAVGWTSDGRQLEIAPGAMLMIDRRKAEYIEFYNLSGLPDAELA